MTSKDLRFWTRWTLANGVGELVGLGIVFGTGFLIIKLAGVPQTPAAIIFLAIVAIGLGAVEGTVVGYTQGRVLRERIPALDGWLRATVWGAVVAWALGMLPSTVMNLLPHDAAAGPRQELSAAAQLLLAAGMGLLAGPILAAFQVRVLRRHVARAWHWIPANALAWAAGMPIIFAGIDAVYAASNPIAAAAMLLVTLLASGVAVGAIHGLVLVRMLRIG